MHFFTEQAIGCVFVVTGMPFDTNSAFPVLSGKPPLGFEMQQLTRHRIDKQSGMICSAVI